MRVSGCCAFLITFVLVSVTDARLRCRRCIGARSLDDCNLSIPCSAGEICFMEETITDQLTIEYNGGCRARDVCQTTRPVVGRRQGVVSDEPVCSGCCDTESTPECNTKLCGIHPPSHSNQCYHCTSDDPLGGSGVGNPDHCTRIASCSTEHVCAVETYRLSTHVNYEFKCINKMICGIIMKENFRRFDSCQSNPAACPELAGTGKRAAFGVLKCTACCGDSVCNYETCQDTMVRMYRLYQAGVLDLDTMKQNGTLPQTTTPMLIPTHAHHG